MDAVAFHHHNLLRFSMCFSFSKQCCLGKSSISMTEVAVQPSIFVFPKVVFPFTNSSIRSDGDKDGQTSRRNENKRPQSFDGKKSKSSDQEEIIALFRRIQSSISKGDSHDTMSKTSSNADKDKPSTESILDILGEPKKQVKDGKIPNKAKEKVLTNRRGVSRKEQGVEEHPHVSDFKLTRPPSNFVRKSPIPSLSTPRGKVIELSTEALPAIMGNKQVQSERLEELKLAELKEVAKSRGVKGYSKLKKGELLKILRS
ncbi:SAP-like protein BP-73 [Gastrolobium bilobum]|uniref:SAP-like protein BP-73 n=1 Tax=Gastrolobium bilobum TaxID=150636 RepID=UPI002AB2EA22|nr:SAP-like protein BP-73 [Gastrolobium bilobum]